jgi:hypothetical protein
MLQNEPTERRTVHCDCGCWFTFLEAASEIKGTHEFHYCAAHRRGLEAQGFPLPEDARAAVRDLQTAPRKRRKRSE